MKYYFISSDFERATRILIMDGSMVKELYLSAIDDEFKAWSEVLGGFYNPFSYQKMLQDHAIDSWYKIKPAYNSLRKYWNVKEITKKQAFAELL